MHRAKRAAILFFVLGFCTCLLLIGTTRFISSFRWPRLFPQDTAVVYYPLGKCPDCRKISSQYWKVGPLNDDNDAHLEAARRMGIEPFQTNSAFEKSRELLVRTGKLAELKDGDTYKLKSLTHSYPYLVPKAVVLLDEIGERFEAKLELLQIAPHLMQISSVFRTNESQNGLGRRNGNATQYSAHMFGTTFDISYKEFLLRNARPAREGFCRHDLMRHVLGEVLTEMSVEGRCRVVIEKKQACFHVTVAK
jgi:hypothetical protein